MDAATIGRQRNGPSRDRYRPTGAVWTADMNDWKNRAVQADPFLVQETQKPLKLIDPGPVCPQMVREGASLLCATRPIALNLR